MDFTVDASRQVLVFNEGDLHARVVLHVTSTAPVVSDSSGLSQEERESSGLAAYLRILEELRLVISQLRDAESCEQLAKDLYTSAVSMGVAVDSREAELSAARAAATALRSKHEDLLAGATEARQGALDGLKQLVSTRRRVSFASATERYDKAVKAIGAAVEPLLQEVANARAGWVRAGQSGLDFGRLVPALPQTDPEQEIGTSPWFQMTKLP